MSAELRASRRDSTLILTLANPGARNAIDPDLPAVAIETLSTAERDDTIRAVVITGEGDYFCAGGDLRRLQENRARSKHVQSEHIDQLHGWIDAIRDCPKPVIAAVEGVAAGVGFSLALACDFIIAGSSAQCMMSQGRMGLTPDGGGSWFIARSLPRQLAAEVLIEGKALTAQRMHALGIVNRVVADGEALDAALIWAEDLARLSLNATERTKSLLRDACTMSLAEQFQQEKQHFVESLHHRDAEEGIQAFFDKRRPDYR